MRKRKSRDDNTYPRSEGLRRQLYLYVHIVPHAVFLSDNNIIIYIYARLLQRQCMRCS